MQRNDSFLQREYNQEFFQKGGSGLLSSGGGMHAEKGHSQNLFGSGSYNNSAFDQRSRGSGFSSKDFFNKQGFGAAINPSLSGGVAANPFNFSGGQQTPGLIQNSGGMMQEESSMGSQTNNSSLTRNNNQGLQLSDPSEINPSNYRDGISNRFLNRIYDEDQIPPADENIFSSSHIGEDFQFSNNKKLPKKKGGCYCSKTKCVKLYCDCFKAGRFCDGLCGCTHCLNKLENLDYIKRLRKYNQKNQRVASSSQEVEDFTCSCRKSFCENRYCPCYKSNRGCLPTCTCFHCKNKNGINPKQLH